MHNFFGIRSFTRCLYITALGLHVLQHRGQEGCGLSLLMEKKYKKKIWFSWR